MVAPAAAVIMLVAPGPIERRAGERGQAVRHLRVAGRGVDHGLLVPRRGRSAGGRPPAAGPGRCPATLPWPKIPNTPGTKRRSVPSRSLCWLGEELDHRLGHGEAPRLHRRPALRARSWARADRAARPAQVSRTQWCVGIVAEGHRALLARSGQHVQVVQVVIRGWPRRARDSRGARGRRRRRATVTVASMAPSVVYVRCNPKPCGAGDAEVVDLLQYRLALARLVVLVGRVGGPVARGGEQLDRRSAGRRRRCRASRSW